jgi:hypothetical protein
MLLGRDRGMRALVNRNSAAAGFIYPISTPHKSLALRKPDRNPK